MLLSICVPTHHGRVQKLRVALDSALDQLDPSHAETVEICVNDNASRDGTEEMVRALSSPVQITYRREPEDRGGATNVMRVLELAHGEWCWTLGSDDAIGPGAVKRALELIAVASGAAGITVYRTAYDAELVSPFSAEPHPGIFPPRSPEARLLRSADEICAEVGLAMTFLSSQLINRRLWGRAIDRMGREQLRTECWLPHVACFAAMIAERPRWVVCGEPLVWQRTGSTELGGTQGSLVRLQVAVAADISRIWSRTPGIRRTTHRELLERWRGEVAGPPMIDAYRSLPGHSRSEELRMVLGFTRVFGGLPRFWLQTAPALALRRAPH